MAEDKVEARSVFDHTPDPIMLRKFVTRPPLPKTPKLSNCPNIAKEINESDYNVLPLYEFAVREHVLKRHYSFNNNEYLKQKWSEYVEEIPTREARPPTNIIDYRDFHFHNGMTKFRPAESKFRVEELPFRYSLKMGPGVDKYGPMPLPSDCKYNVRARSLSTH